MIFLSFSIIFLLKLDRFHSIESQSFKYLAIRDDQHELKSRHEYKFVLDIEDADVNETLVKSVSKRDVSDLFSNLKLLNSDPYDLDEEQASKRQIILNSSQYHEKDKSNSICLYSNIKNKINECFQKSSDCTFENFLL